MGGVKREQCPGLQAGEGRQRKPLSKGLKTEIVPNAGVGAGDVPDPQGHELAESRCLVTPGQWER